LTENELIERGIRAEILLKDATMQEVVTDLVNLLRDSLLTTKPEEKEQRERIYFAYQGLNDLIGLLNQMVSIRLEIEKQRNADEENI
jgi:hypothetical protein